MGSATSRRSIYHGLMLETRRILKIKKEKRFYQSFPCQRKPADFAITSYTDEISLRWWRSQRRGRVWQTDRRGLHCRFLFGMQNAFDDGLHSSGSNGCHQSFGCPVAIGRTARGYGTESSTRRPRDAGAKSSLPLWIILLIITINYGNLGDLPGAMADSLRSPEVREISSSADFCRKLRTKNAFLCVSHYLIV